jgi:hypothetical protein
VEERKAAIAWYSLGCWVRRVVLTPHPLPPPRQNILSTTAFQIEWSSFTGQVVSTGPSSAHFCQTVGAFMAYSALVAQLVFWGEVV